MDNLEERFAALQAQNLELQQQFQNLLLATKPLQEQNVALQTQLEQACKAATPPLPTEPSSIFKVSAKLPPFWRTRPATWFAQVESQFNLAGITVDQTKYDHILGQLDERTLGEIEDLLDKLPAKDKYLTIKTELIRRLSMSEGQRVRQLVSEEELGDRRPSQFLRHLKTLAGPSMSDEKILRQLWMRRLPRHLQAILAAQEDLPLDKVAELADRILEVSPGSPAQVHSTSDSGITARLDELARQVAALTSDSRHRSRTRSSLSRSRNRNGSRSRAPTPGRDSRSSWCWYHNRFQEKATKCHPPCTWKQAEN